MSFAVSAEVSEWAALPAAPRLDLLERFWRFFCSLRLTVVLLILFALGMVAGTFVNPQNDPLIVIERAYATTPWKLELYRALQLYDLFHSWWFTLVLALIALNLIACTLERLPRVALTVLNPERKLTDAVLRGIRQKRTVASAAPVEATLKILQTQIAAEGFSAAWTERDGGTTYLFAERGWWARFGVWIVHAALLLILGGGLIGRFLGFEGTMVLPQGGGELDFVNVKSSDGSTFKKRLGFTVRCDDFRLKKFKNGEPRAFESDLSVLGGGMFDGGHAPSNASDTRSLILKQTILVNHPLRYAGLSFYQATYQEDAEHARARVALVDKSSGGRKSFNVVAGESFGEGAAKFSIEAYEPDFQAMGPAAQIVRTEGAQKTTFWVFANRPEFDAKNRIDRYAVEFEKIEPNYSTGLQVARDPGVPLVYTGCFLLFLGLFVAFAKTHQRVWARIDAGRVTIAGGAHRNAPSFDRVFENLAKAVEA